MAKSKSKNIFLLLIGIVAVGALGYYAYSLSTKEKTSLSAEDMIDFAIEDTASIDKIELIPAQGQPFTLSKKDGIWTGPDNYCISQEPVYFILEAIKNIEFKGYPDDAAQENIKNLMTVEGQTVNIYQNGKLSKTWIVGSSTPDHYGCYMLLQKDNKQSPKAVITDMQGFHGTLQTRFYADPLKWACTNLFKYHPSELSKIEIINNEKKHRSFSVEINGDDFIVKRENVKTPFDTIQVRNHILNYKKIHYENITVELKPEEIDSIKNTTPYILMKVTEKTGKTRSFRCFRKKPYEGKLLDLEGNPIQFDQDRFWIELEDGRFARSQYFVFDKLFLGYRDIFGDYSLE